MQISIVTTRGVEYRSDYRSLAEVEAELKEQYEAALAEFEENPYARNSARPLPVNFSVEHTMAQTEETMKSFTSLTYLSLEIDGQVRYFNPAHVESVYFDRSDHV